MSAHKPEWIRASRPASPNPTFLFLLPQVRGVSTIMDAAVWCTGLGLWLLPTAKEGEATPFQQKYSKLPTTTLFFVAARD